MRPDINTLLADIKHVQLTDARAAYQAGHPAPLLHINHPRVCAMIALQGAQLLSFRPTGQQDWLWLSPYNCFTPGKAIRGGIPLCLPWFGVNRYHAGWQRHGFVRNETWQLTAIRETDTGVTTTLAYTYDGHSPGAYGEPFRAEISITCSDQVKLKLAFHHMGSQPRVLSFAWHTYFQTADSTTTTLEGLEGFGYLDNTEKLAPRTCQGTIRFGQPVDSVFCNTGTQHLKTHESLRIGGHHCPTCIVWNPGIEAAKHLADIQDQARHFVCVERGAAFDDEITLAGGQAFNSEMNLQKDNSWH